jgi:hypothetical protein
MHLTPEFLLLQACCIGLRLVSVPAAWLPIGCMLTQQWQQPPPEVWVEQHVVAPPRIAGLQAIITLVIQHLSGDVGLKLQIASNTD